MNIEHLIQSFGPVLGLVVITAIVFAESGLLIGFFLPGDSLLFTSGFLASQGFLDIKLLAFLSVVAAISGDSVGYAFGRRVGRRLFHRQDSLFFSKENLERAEKFYEEHGKKTIVLARFMPVIRTFAPIVAGIGDMDYKTFITYNIVGGIAWALGLSLGGYFLGKTIPDVDKYLLPIIALIIILSVAPSAYHILKEKKNREHIMNFLKKYIKK